MRQVKLSCELRNRQRHQSPIQQKHQMAKRKASQPRTNISKFVSRNRLKDIAVSTDLRAQDRRRPKPRGKEKVSAERKVERLRQSQPGQPFGDEAWTERTAKRLDLQSTLRPRDRPRKSLKRILTPSRPRDLPERPSVCPKCKSPRWDKPKLFEREKRT